MRSERRHELQHNVLLQWLIEAYKKVEPYTNAILAVLLLTVVALVAWSWWQNRTSESHVQGWDDLYAAMDSRRPEDLDAVVQRHAGSEVGHWAGVVAGDMRLSLGCQGLLNNKALASQHLQEARDNYLPIVEQAANPQLQERATFGLARTYEAMASTRQSQGELDRAAEQYNRVLERWPGGLYADWASRRLDDLKRSETKEFYDAFAKYEPERPPATSMPPGGPVFDPDSLDEPASSSPSSTTTGEPSSPLTLPIETPVAPPAAKPQAAEGAPQQDAAPVATEEESAAKSQAAEEAPQQDAAPATTEEESAAKPQAAEEASPTETPAVEQQDTAPAATEEDSAAKPQAAE
jgi:hypothetical protein